MSTNRHSIKTHVWKQCPFIHIPLFQQTVLFLPLTRPFRREIKLSLQSHWWVRFEIDEISDNMIFACAGKNGAVLFDHFHCGGVPQNPGNGPDPPQRKLSEKYVEHDGLCCRCHGVSNVFPFNNFYLSTSFCSFLFVLTILHIFVFQAK